MDEHERLQLLGLLPEGIELWRADLLAFDAAADGGADQIQLLHAMFKLFGGEFRELQRNRSVPQEAAGNRFAHLGDLFTLKIEHPAREVAVRCVPERVDTEHLYVDAVLDSVRDASGANRKADVTVEMSARMPSKLATFDNVLNAHPGTVSVHVDSRDALRTERD